MLWVSSYRRILKIHSEIHVGKIKSVGLRALPIIDAASDQNDITVWKHIPNSNAKRDVTMTDRPYVWQMVKESVEQSQNKIITYKEIREYIGAHYENVNVLTINAQIIECTVNHTSRVHYPMNVRPRISDKEKDFLYYVGRGKVSLYDRSKHGSWCIKETDNGKLEVVKLKEGIELLIKPSISAESDGSKHAGQKQKTKFSDVPRPCKDQVEHYLDTWDNLENYTLQESALNKLFFETYPENYDIDYVLIKASSLNDFYSTNIFSIFPVAKHIVNLDIDERLAEGDEDLVDEIATVKMLNGTTKRFYSFATKYCSHHRPLEYPIYDSYVDEVLRHFREADGFHSFRNADLRDYPSFKNILLKFMDFYGLTDYSVKDIDRYLWQLGKEMLTEKKT